MNTTVIDRANELCMAARRARAAKAQSSSFQNGNNCAEPTRNKYRVSWGWMRQESADFVTFPEALAKYVDLAGEEPQVTGEGYDCDCDEDGFYVVSTGLTEDEEEAVELAGAAAQ